MMNTSRRLLLAALLILTGGLGHAAEGTPWNQLTVEQRQLLQKAHEDHWNRMPAEKQQRMLEGAERWQKMTPEERARVQAKREKFRSMPPEERRRMHERHRERREAFERLPPERQKALRECWQRRKSGEAVDCHTLLPEKPASPGVLGD